jgi:hypothetical protein
VREVYLVQYFVKSYPRWILRVKSGVLIEYIGVSISSSGVSQISLTDFDRPSIIEKEEI